MNEKLKNLGVKAKSEAAGWFGAAGSAAFMIAGGYLGEASGVLAHDFLNTMGVHTDVIWDEGLGMGIGASIGLFYSLVALIRSKRNANQ